MEQNKHPAIAYGDITPDHIRKTERKIFAEATTWLFGLDKPAGLLTRSLFIRLPYNDKLTRSMKLAPPHVMFAGHTGTGKTALVQSVSFAVRAQERRVQGTPDLMPQDIIGSPTIVEDLKGNRTIQFKPGPIFNHLFFCDEANRMRPQAGSALIEAMEERSITPKNEYLAEELTMKRLPLFPLSGRYDDVEGERFFMVLLTQNILDDEAGAFPNPMAVLDRITMFILIDRPPEEEERKIRAENVEGKSIQPVTDLYEISACADWIHHNIKLSGSADKYITKLLRNTDPDPRVTDSGSEVGKFLKEYVAVGASPRVNYHLEAVARSEAFFAGSNEVRPEHVKAVAKDVIVHRLILKPGKEFKTTKEEVFEEILKNTEKPLWK